MKTRILTLLDSPFPYYLNDRKKNILHIAGTSIFLAAFILVFHPGHPPIKAFLVPGVTFLVMFSSISYFPSLLPKLFDTLKWTFGKHLIFTLTQLIIIGFCLAVTLHYLKIVPHLSFIEILLHVYPSTFTHGILPVVINTLLIKNQMLRMNLDSAIAANRELEKIRLMRDLSTENRGTNVVTIYSDTSETLKLNMPDLLFVEASDNYSTFFWKSGQSIEKRMLRMNLKSVESQLNNSFAIRCHRSYIINVYAIDTLTGNTNGYKLSIAGSDFSVPVSRSKGREVIEKIEQVRSVMELR